MFTQPRIRTPSSCGRVIRAPTLAPPSDHLLIGGQILRNLGSGPPRIVDASLGHRRLRHLAKLSPIPTRYRANRPVATVEHLLRHLRLSKLCPKTT